MDNNDVKVPLNVPPEIAKILEKNAGDLARIHPADLDMLLTGQVGYFNPLIGGDERETFDKISDMMGLLTEIAKQNHHFSDDFSRGVTLINQMVWSAAQFWEIKLRGREVPV